MCASNDFPALAVVGADLGGAARGREEPDEHRFRGASAGPRAKGRTEIGDTLNKACAALEGQDAEESRGGVTSTASASWATRQRPSVRSSSGSILARATLSEPEIVGSPMSA